MSSLVSAADSMDWDEYLRWLTSTKHRNYGRNIWFLGKKVYMMAFTPELVLMEHTRRKEDVLKAISNICCFLDIKHDTYFHEQFLEWLKRKEVRWKRARGPYENYSLAETLTISHVAKNIRVLPPKYGLFATFALVSGLRTEEVVRAFNDHLQLCNGRVIEMFWDRRTKKANAVFCHPTLHKKISLKISYNSIHRHLHSRVLGCQLRYIRKLHHGCHANRSTPGRVHAGQTRKRLAEALLPAAYEVQLPAVGPDVGSVRFRALISVSFLSFILTGRALLF